jgi:hypothetical protein
MQPAEIHRIALVEELDEALGARIGAAQFREPGGIGDPFAGCNHDDVVRMQPPGGQPIRIEEVCADRGAACTVRIRLDAHS